MPRILLLLCVTWLLQSAPLHSAGNRQIAAPFPVTLAWVPRGQYWIGDGAGDGQADEGPRKQVQIEGFWAMTTEVTVAMYARYAEAAALPLPEGCWEFVKGWTFNPSLNWREPGFKQEPDHPVTCISWHDAHALAAWLTEETGLAWALPSEAQWEYLARAGSEARYAFGDDAEALCEYSNGADQRALEHYPGFSVNNCDDGHTRTAPVASYRGNAFGLYDVHGNVWEWVEDCWHDSYAGLGAAGDARRDPPCERRAYRGGAYGDIPGFLRVSLRNRAPANERRDDIGVRLIALPASEP